MSQITSIETQPRHKNRRSIFVDGEFFAGVDEEVAVLLNLKAGRDVNPEDLRRILEREEEIRARELVLRWLEITPRTRRQLADRLRRKGVEDAVAGRVLDRLQATGLVNDDAYAREWVKARAHGGMGRRRLSAELARRGVERDTADAALDEEASADEAGACLEAARRQAAKYRGLPREAARRRLVGFLSRRGFAGEDIFRAVDQVLPPEEREE